MAINNAFLHQRVSCNKNAQYKVKKSKNTCQNTSQHPFWLIKKPIRSSILENTYNIVTGKFFSWIFFCKNVGLFTVSQRIFVASTYYNTCPILSLQLILLNSKQQAQWPDKSCFIKPIITSFIFFRLIPTGVATVDHLPTAKIYSFSCCQRKYSGHHVVIGLAARQNQPRQCRKNSYRFPIQRYFHHFSGVSCLWRSIQYVASAH